MLDLSSILNNEAFTPEEQLEIIKYIDAKLEQQEFLLLRLECIARQALKDDTLDAERQRLQAKVKEIQNEIDQISEQLPQTFVIKTSSGLSSE